MSNLGFPLFGGGPVLDPSASPAGVAPTSSAARPAQTANPITPPPSPSPTTSATPAPTSTPSPITTSSTPSPTSTPITTTTPGTPPATDTTTPPSPSPTPVPPITSNTIPTHTTILQTVTRADGQGSVVVITQTVANPAATNIPGSNNRKNEDSGSVLAIAIPCAIAGLVALVGLGLLIRWLKGRSASARAAEDIKWPEVVNSDGDRAALYPEPTRPGLGHGLGDEEEDGMAAAQMGEARNYAGAGAGHRGNMPHTIGPNSTGLAPNYLNSAPMQDQQTNLQHFYSASGFPGPPPPHQVAVPPVAYSSYYNSANAPQAYPNHSNPGVPGGVPLGPRDMQQAYGGTDYYNNGQPDYGQYHQDKDYNNSPQDYAQHHSSDHQHEDYNHPQDKEYDDPLGIGKEGGYITDPTQDQYQSHSNHSHPEHHEPGGSATHQSSPNADHPESPVTLSDENFYREPSRPLSDHHVEDHSPDPNGGGGGRRLVALNPDEDQ
ncbi:hypothetical protein MJO29_002743 [Puccinia striiformis f. sp. tritici]|nr:hypothetical protein MJO29_002743 [Puccinia striiformis f. sp. tritici]